MLTYIFSGHTDGAPWDKHPWVSNDILDTWDHVREVLRSVVGDHMPDMDPSILSEVGAVLRTRTDEVGTGRTYTYGESADVVGGGWVAWGFSISVLP